MDSENKVVRHAQVVDSHTALYPGDAYQAMPGCTWATVARTQTRTTQHATKAWLLQTLERRGNHFLVYQCSSYCLCQLEQVHI